MKSYTVSYVLHLWRQSKDAKGVSSAFEEQLKIALKLYVLPELASSISKLKPKEFALALEDLPIDNLQDGLEIFNRRVQEAFEQGLITKGTRANYRSVFKRFWMWLEKQVWWQEILSTPIGDDDVAPFRATLLPKPTKGKYSSYGLSKEQLPEQLKQEIDAFKQFRLVGVQKIGRITHRRRRCEDQKRYQKPKVITVKQRTFENDEQAILRFLGWYAKNNPDSMLSLDLLTDIDLLDNYTYWSTGERGTTHSSGVNMLSTAIAIAKWLNYEKSMRRNWTDIPIILELQDLQREYAEIYEQEKQENENKKWISKKLTHEQARQVVQYLHLLCAPNYGRHDKETGEFLKHGTRQTSSVARAWQAYLLVKILVYCPVRQEEIRRLILGETLFRREDKQGKPYYVVKHKEHKRSSTRQKPREYKLPAILTEDLDLWLYKWRPLIEESVQTLEKWTEFWGYYSRKIEDIEARLELAKQGIVSEKVRSSIDEYIERETARLQGARNRVAGWEIAKANLESHNYVFFIAGKRNPESFGKPHYVASIWRIVNRAIAFATLSLFGEPKWTNPHALRHIAEKHIRQIGKSNIADAFGTFIGHSKEMGDEYAEQITSEYELTEPIVDDWWE